MENNKYGRGVTRITSGNARHSDHQKEDYYATDPIAIDLLLEQEKFNKKILEPSVGGGHLAYRLKELGYDVIASDIIDRGYPKTKIINIFDYETINNCDIITNPPYKIAKDYIEHLLTISDKGTKVAMFLKLTFLESKQRKPFFEKYPPKVIYIFSSRIICAKNGEFEKYPSSTVAYAWYVWEVGYVGETTIKWIN